MQNSEIRLVRRWAVLSFDSSALQPDLRILWNISIFHLKAYHSSFSMAPWRDCTGRSVISFHSMFFLFFGVSRSTAWITVNVSAGYRFLFADRRQDANLAISDLKNRFVGIAIAVSDFDAMQSLDGDLIHFVGNRVISVPRQAVDTGPD